MGKKKTTNLAESECIQLIEDGASYDKKIKKLQIKLDAVKAKIKANFNEGNFATQTGASVSVVYAEQYTDPDPGKVYRWFKKNANKTLFFSAVKITTTKAKAIMGEPEFKKTRDKKEIPLIRISFKSLRPVEVETKASETGSTGKRIIKFKSASKEDNK